MGHRRHVAFLIYITVVILLTGQAALAAGGISALSTQPSERCRQAVSALDAAAKARAAESMAKTAAAKAKTAAAKAKTAAAKAKTAAAKAKTAAAKAKTAAAKAKTAAAKAKTAAAKTIGAYRKAANQLRVLPQTSPDLPAACDEALRESKLNQPKIREIRRSGVSLLLGSAAQRFPLNRDDAISLVEDAHALAGTTISPCGSAKALREAESFDQAEALLNRLVASGDSDTVACAKQELGALAADRIRASDSRGVVERLSAQSSGSVVPVLLAASVTLLVALILWRLRQGAFPPPPRTARTRRLWARCAGAGLTASAVSVGALVGAYLSGSWLTQSFLDRLQPSSPVLWLIGFVCVIGCALIAIWLGRRLASAEQPVLTGPAAWVGLPLAAVAGLTAATLWAVARQWLSVAAAVAAVVLLTAWAGSRLRLSFGEFKGGEKAPKGFAGAVAAELMSLGTEAPRGVDLVAGTDQTQLPADALGALPGGKWASALLAAWRAITPSVDLVVTGEFLEESEKSAVAVTLRRGRRVQSSVTIESQMFDSAGANTAASKPPNEARMAVWHDLATAVAAWLLHELPRMTGEDLRGLAGAKRWQSTALNAVAAHRLEEHQDAAALPLLLRAVSLDPANIAAQYGRLALEARRINGSAPDAGRRYGSTYEALRGLPLEGPAHTMLRWRRTYNMSTMLVNGVRAAGRKRLPMRPDRAAEEAAKELGQLITELRSVKDQKTEPLAQELLDLSRPACLGAALLAGTDTDAVRTAVSIATADTHESRNVLAQQTQLRSHINRWLDPKKFELLEPRASYNAACTRVLLDRKAAVKPEKGPRKLEAFLHRAFQDRRLAEYAGRDPFLKELWGLPWFRHLQEEAGVQPKPIGLAAFAAVSGHTEALAKADVDTLKELHARLQQDEERRELSSMRGLPEQQLLRWRTILDLWSLPGTEQSIPIETINLLVAVGIDSIAALSTQEAREVRERLEAARRALGADIVSPEEAELEKWINQARATQQRSHRAADTGTTAAHFIHRLLEWVGKERGASRLNA
jgi:hypothetical protein